MALRFIDSFDHYSTSDLIGTGNGQKWSVVNSTVQWSISNGTGRYANSLRMTRTTSGASVVKTLDNQATWCVGFAFKLNQLPSSSIQILSLYDSGTLQVDLRINNSATLSVTRNGTAVTNGTSVSTIAVNTWYYIEMLCTISSSISANTWQVNVNSVQWINVATSQSSKNTANATASQIYIGPIQDPGTSSIWDYDDLYICDGSGSTNNTFLGDVRIECKIPNAAGANTAWTANGGTALSSIADPTPNGDINFISSNVTNQISTFLLPALANTPSSIFGVQTVHTSRKTDAGARSIADVVVSGTTTSPGTTVSLASSYAIYSHILETDPNTSSTWTGSAVNSMEVGVKEIT